MEVIKETKKMKAVPAAKWFDELRETARARFEKIGFPSKDSEPWKYVHLTPLLSQEPSTEAEVPTATQSQKVKGYFLEEPSAVRLVFWNGIFSKELSYLPGLPTGVIIESLKEAIHSHPDLVKRHLAQKAGEEKDGFVAVNTFNFVDGVFIYLPAGARLTAPVQILWVNSGEPANLAVFYPRLLAVLEKKAGAELLLQSVGLGESPYLVNGVAEIHLEEGAFLNTVKFWEEAEESRHLDKTFVSLGKEARFELQSFTESGKMIRSDITADLLGERAFVSLKGLSILSDESAVHQVAVVNHRVPQCESRQLYKNILAGKSRSEFNSLVYVHPDAQKSDSSQLNKNLLLSDTARAFTRPQLKIYADDVKCNHGATVGRLEKDELFYLTSRGISKTQARTMITYGFVKELIQVRWMPSLEKRLEAIFHSRLEKILENSGDKK